LNVFVVFRAVGSTLTLSSSHFAAIGPGSRQSRRNSMEAASPAHPCHGSGFREKLGQNGKEFAFLDDCEF
jgi:hypothetical protein